MLFLQFGIANPNVTESEDCEYDHFEQRDLDMNSLFHHLIGLYVNVIRPANTSVHAKLPVLFVSGRSALLFSRDCTVC